MKNKFKTKGFTLAEILVVLAMIAIITGGVFALMSDQRQRGRESQSLSVFSSLVQPMMMCWSDGYYVRTPENSADDNENPGSICMTSADAALDGYGQWPDISSSSSMQYLDSYVAVDPVGNRRMPRDAWYFYAKFSDKSRYVCCNSKNSMCGIVDDANCSSANVAGF